MKQAFWDFIDIWSHPDRLIVVARLSISGYRSLRYASKVFIPDTCIDHTFQGVRIDGGGLFGSLLPSAASSLRSADPDAGSRTFLNPLVEAGRAAKVPYVTPFDQTSRQLEVDGSAAPTHLRAHGRAVR